MRFLLLTFTLCFSSLSHATLFDRGLGMIYDSDQNLTWLQDANYSQTSGYDSDGAMNWQAAKDWASSLSFGGFDDWRLPTVLPANGVTFKLTYSWYGLTDVGFNNSSLISELGYLFYHDLLGVPYLKSSGAVNTPYGINTALSPFINIAPGAFTSYWTGAALNATSAFLFQFDEGYQWYTLKSNSAGVFAWAVRDGDVPQYTPPVIVPVPEPLTVGLLGLGLLLMLGFKRNTINQHWATA